MPVQPEQREPFPRPQDHLRLRDGAAARGQGVINPHSAALWTVLSLPLLGYFVWYYRAYRDCSRLLDDSSDPWLWMAMLFPGMVLVVPYAIAQAKVVARVEIASKMSLSTAGYAALCVGGFLIPALMPLVLQPRLNRAARIDPAQLRRMPIR
jgi:hypothetical protein